MTIDRFQSLVLTLANQCFVRYYLCLDYPKWVRMGLKFHKEPPRTLQIELEQMGFTRDENMDMWIVPRD